MAQSTTSTLDISTVPAEVVTAEAAAPGKQVVRRKAAQTTRAVTAKRRRARIDWYGLGIGLLILLSSAVAIYRLLWSWQP